MAKKAVDTNAKESFKISGGGTRVGAQEGIRFNRSIVSRGGEPRERLQCQRMQPDGVLAFRAWSCSAATLVAGVTLMNQLFDIHSMCSILNESGDCERARGLLFFAPGAVLPPLSSYSV